MTTSIADKNLLVRLGKALEYPDAFLPAHLAAVVDMAAGKKDIQDAIEEFKTESSTYSSDRLAELYTRTFDVGPRCIPYLSIHLFGEESFHRARLMVGMRGSLLAAGVDPGTELPDHLTVVLRAAADLPEEEWEELVEFVLRAGLHAMLASIVESDNPYRWLLLAVQEVVGQATEEDMVRLQTARRHGKNLQPPGSQQSCGGC